MKKILVANRGEIALRIMRSCKEMGISTVAVFSEADRNAPFVRYADEAVCIGPPASSQSYLNGKKIIEVCKTLKVDAIHPGYGFLSENAEFAREVGKSGIIFIGPSAEAMEMMGDKLSAKATAKKHNIPMVPGTDGAIDDIKTAKKVAKEIGFPVLIKASAGGGGKGMRVVKNENDLEEEVKRASSEAKSAFGDGAVFIEKYVEKPRHVEIQILADKHGNVVYLFERECSVQRRHQKVVEEAPSTVLTPEMRKKMGECAVSLAKACGYVGAGTVEFLVEEAPTLKGEKTEANFKDKNNKSKHKENSNSSLQGGGLHFYFLEVNTRLQVEHPVTEMITGIDLVKEQIKVAQGEKLSFKQDDMEISGHAIEVRVYAEDPANNFLPDIGKLAAYKVPRGSGIRVDDGFEEGMDIPIYYDPMIAKLIAHGKDRKEAIGRLIRAIDEYQIVGVETTLPFCKFVLNHEAFISGDFDTHFAGSYFSPEKIFADNEEEAFIASLVSAELFNSTCHGYSSIPLSQRAASNWKRNRISHTD
ncbi:MAG: acetyl-CoA carboxylase biotin carboxylase subunit [Bacteroidetes bacterium]|nr:MAG: acetyl-CoA carboxylase biotin carboxylase subunit [Bacteroidota bacterium]